MLPKAKAHQNVIFFPPKLLTVQPYSFSAFSKAWKSGTKTSSTTSTPHAFSTNTQTKAL